MMHSTANSAGFSRRSANRSTVARSLLLSFAFSFAAFGLLAAVGCNSDKPAPGSAPAPSVVTSARPQAKAPVMEETTSAVVARIQSKGFQVQNLSVLRSGTVLKLSGVAKTEADKKGAEDVARASPGVTDIQSSITIAP